MKNKKLKEKINALKKKKNAVILVHNYQRPEIYEVADFIGDSFGLAREATKVDRDIIVFCGVDFMAESAYILNPGKTVLLPSRDAECPMAAMVKPHELKELKEKYPGAGVVSYVNTTADTKALSDVCCTSSNAVEVVNSLPNNQIIFVPDKNLAAYVQRFTDKEIIPWSGFCYVHNKILKEDLEKTKARHPNAKVVVHPECKPEIIDLADKVCSTSTMIKYARESDVKEFIIGTERGMVERLRLEVPEKTFIYVGFGQTCMQMKKNTLENVLAALQEMKHVVIVPEDTRIGAYNALNRMLKVGK